jgi:hypothetical protein
MLRDSNREDFPSLQRLKEKLAKLSGLVARRIDCCVNSCMAFTGASSNLTVCTFCREPRFVNSQNREKPRRQYDYLPLAYRLVASYRSERQAKLLAAYPAEVKAARGVGGCDLYRDVWNGSIMSELEA